MINYEPSLLRKLNQNTTIAESFGGTVLLKPVPEFSHPGIDPREKALFQSSLSSNRRPAVTLQDHRDDTGFPGLNLNTATILTDKITLHKDEREIVIWEYRLRHSKHKGDSPVLLYVHGGSFFAGSAQFMENLCKYICQFADCVVYNVEYSLAPEKPFPCGYEDCLCALDYIYDNAQSLGIDKNKVCIAGDSAGAGIGASVALCDGKEKIRYMALLYPCVIMDTETPFEWREEDFHMNNEEKPYILPRLNLGRSDGKGNIDFMRFIGEMYLSGNGDLRFDPRVSPLFADMTNSPKATVITADYDGLRPQGEYFAAKLKSFGADVRCIRYKGVFHAFAERTGYLPQAQDALDEIVKDILSL